MTKKTDKPSILEAVLRPPPHVSQRCGAKARSTGQPCKRFASIGHVRCKFHGGARGSGRPQIHGKRSAQAERNAAFLRLTKMTLRSRFRKPKPVVVFIGGDDDSSV